MPNPKLETKFLSAFTYFVDTDGYIFYSRGDNTPASDYVAATLVYIPFNPPDADRYLPSSHCMYRKFIVDGFESEFSGIKRELTEKDCRMIRSRMILTENGEEYLQVPSDQIVKVFKPKHKLDQIIAGRSTYPEKIVDRVLSTVKLFTDRGINLDRIGLYGGLQCGLNSLSENHVGDVDILIDGSDAYATVVELARAYGSTIGNPDFARPPSSARGAARLRRLQLSELRLPDFPDTIVDIKLTHSALDRKKLHRLPASPQILESDFYTEGEVIDAKLSLSLPVQYTVAGGSESFTVRSNRYADIGAATIGDRVKIHGLLTPNNTVVLTKPEEHYIVCANLA